ncbi:MAG: hypothetical protein FVQ77_16585 [Cytophagales bacterium]|nr:hypothetical protein [Cytophagales bacterium]
MIYPKTVSLNKSWQRQQQEAGLPTAAAYCCLFVRGLGVCYKIRGIVFTLFNNVVGNWNEDVFENILTDALRYNDFRVEQQKEFVKHYNCNNGLIINFNNTLVDFRFI